jgi:yapsin 1/2
MALVNAENYVKLDVKKLKGSWAHNADIEKDPIYAYYKNNLNETSSVNGSVVGVFNDKIYYAVDLAFGSNAQNLTVLVDTVSSDLWINSVDNEVCAKGRIDNEEEDEDDDDDDDDGEGVSGSGNNFTINYVYTHTPTSLTSSSSSPASSTSSDSTTPVTTSYSSYYDSSADVYYYDGHVLTQTTTQTTTTETHVTTHSYDIAFYPQISGTASTSWLAPYPHPTFPIESLEVLVHEPQNCSSWGLFNAKKSNSFINSTEPFESVDVDDNEVAGYWAKDSVAYGDSLLTNLTFGLVSEAASDSFGVLGLGLKNAESTWLYNGTVYDNFLDQLKSQGYINKTVYAIYDNYLTEGSSLLFGAVDLGQFIGNLTVVPLVEVPFAFNDTNNSSAIAITLSSISYEETTDDKNTTALIASGLGAAIIDTASATGAFPYYIYDEIVAVSGFMYSESLDTFIANSTELVNKTIVFDFQGVEVTIPILDLTFPLVDIASNKTSDLVVLGVDATPDNFILGDAILQYLYVAIDLEDKEIAIAPKNFSPKSEHIVAVTKSFPNATTASSYSYTYGYNHVTDLKLSTVHDPNSIPTTSFSASYVASVTPYVSTSASTSAHASTSSHASHTKK